MVTLTRPQRLISGLTQPLSLPALAAGASGGLVALVFLVVPAGLLESAVMRSGIPAVLAAAEPPLGVTARIALALLFGGLAAGFAWFGVELAHDHKTDFLDRILARFRRGDIHPDAPPRPPLFANRDLGTPFMGVTAAPSSDDPDQPVERDLPVDLDQPMAAFDPGALLATPLPAPEAVAPLASAIGRPQLIDPGDRFETFELTPILRPAAPEPAARPVMPSNPAPLPDSSGAISLRGTDPTPVRPVVAPETETSVHALLERLERGIAARDAAYDPLPVRRGGLQDTLADLRTLATGTR